MKTINPQIQDSQKSLSTKNTFFLKYSNGHYNQMIKISNAEKIRVTKRKITNFLPKATSEKTLNNILKKCLSWNSILTENIFQKQS